ALLCIRTAVAALVDHAGAVAVRDDARVGHAVAEGIVALLDVAGIDPRGGDADAHLAGGGRWIVHLADHEDGERGALALVPGCFHLRAQGAGRRWCFRRTHRRRQGHHLRSALCPLDDTPTSCSRSSSSSPPPFP